MKNEHVVFSMSVGIFILALITPLIAKKVELGETSTFDAYCMGFVLCTFITYIAHTVSSNLSLIAQESPYRHDDDDEEDDG